MARVNFPFPFSGRKPRSSFEDIRLSFLHPPGTSLWQEPENCKWAWHLPGLFHRLAGARNVPWSRNLLARLAASEPSDQSGAEFQNQTLPAKGREGSPSQGWEGASMVPGLREVYSPPSILGTKQPTHVSAPEARVLWSGEAKALVGRETWQKQVHGAPRAWCWIPRDKAGSTTVRKGREEPSDFQRENVPESGKGGANLVNHIPSLLSCRTPARFGSTHAFSSITRALTPMTKDTIKQMVPCGGGGALGAHHLVGPAATDAVRL